MANDLWRTPPWLFRWLNDIYGPFDIDLAASAENALCANYLTIEQNALTIPWHTRGTNGFCNPPYSGLPPWLSKAFHESHAHAFKSTWVLPVWNGDRHWLANVYSEAAKEVTQIYGRIGFIDFDGSIIPGNRVGTVIVHYDGITSPLFAQILHTERDKIRSRYESEKR